MFKTKKEDFQNYSNMSDQGFCGIDSSDFFSQINQQKKDELLIIEYVFDDGI